MTWHYSLNQNPATYTAAVWQLLQTLLAATWSQTQSSDSFSFSTFTAGPVANPGTGPTGLNNSGAWVVYTSPLGAGGPSFMFQSVQNMFPFSPGQDSAWLCYYSPAAGFTTGAGLMTPPSASDQQPVLFISGFSGAQWFNYNTTEGAMWYNCAAQDVAPYAFWAAAWASPLGTPSSTPEGCIFFDGVTNGAASESLDADPHVVCIDANGYGFNAAMVAAPWNTVGNSGCSAWQPNGGPMAAVQGTSFPYTTPTSGLLPDPTDGNDQVRPLEYCFIGGYYKGQTKSIFWEMTGTSGTPRGLGSLLTVSNPGDYIVIGQLALPWQTGITPLFT